MKKLMFLLFFISGMVLAQVDYDSVYIAGTESNAIKLDFNEYIVEFYFGSSFAGTEVEIQSGDISDTTNFVTLQDIYGNKLKITGINAPARVYVALGTEGLYGQRTIRLKSNASETGQWIKYKSVFMR